jgi:hypothetical protein
VSAWTDTVGIDPAKLVDDIVAKGISKYDAARLVNNLVAINLGQSPRHFVFSQALPTADPATCPPSFARSFNHQDWIDGESVVQAGESADDKGFNWRFNALAADLDSLHVDALNMYQCLKTLRLELVAALNDVAAELNRIDSDIAGAVVRLPAENPWKLDVTEAPQFLGIRELDGSKVTMWKTGQGVMVLPTVDTINLQETVVQHLSTGGLISRFASDNVQFAKDLGHGIPVEMLIEKYGSQPLGDGRTLAQGLAILPPSSIYSNPLAAVDAINTAEQGYIRSTVGSVDAMNAVTGVTSEGAPLTGVGTATIAGEIPGVPANLASGMSKAGLNTVGDVAALSSKQLVNKLGILGVKITIGQAGELTSRAQMIAGLGG